jgi:hypothetical protein
MNKQQARAYVLRMMAHSLRHDLENGSGWIYDAPEAKETHSEGGEMRNERDVTRIEQAIHDEIASLEKRATKANAKKGRKLR